jgi:hypothetical protein
MTMPQISYGEIADRTIRSFLKAVVLIDDHWSEGQNTPTFAEPDFSLLNLDPQPLPPQESVDLVSTTQDEEKPAILTRSTDPTYLRDIGSEITKQGLLFTGFSYTDALKQTAFELASKSDILILDWYLGAEDSRPALDLLDSLKNSGSPRFIFILTDQDLNTVRNNIVEHLGGGAEETDFIFNCGHFVFSLKNKPQKGGPNTVIANKVLDEAIAGIRLRYGGLLQLAALELLGQYRDCLHEVLDHFHSDTDFPFILEWLENGSPIQDSHSFNALAIDEWTARVTRRFPPSTSQTITKESVSALLTDWNKSTTLPDKSEEIFKELIKADGIPFPQERQKVAELMESLNKWFDSHDSRWPDHLEGASKNTPWSKKTKRTLAMNYLSIRKKASSPIETLKALDALFQCQAYLPFELNQGTVLQDSYGSYLICITPTCDCSRPSRINKCYVFLEANKVNIATPKEYSESAVVAIRTKDDGNILLAVKYKPTFTYKIDNPSLAGVLQATATYGAGSPFNLKPIAQLRPSRVQSLVSLAAGMAIEVGLDRSELLRQLFKSNSSE